MQGEFQTLVGHLGDELHQRQQYAQQHGQVLEDVDEDDLLFEHDFPDVGSPLEGYYALNPQQGVGRESGKEQGRHETEPAHLDPLFVKYALIIVSRFNIFRSAQ